MIKWQKRVCLMLVAAVCITAAMTATAFAEENCEHEYVPTVVAESTCTEPGIMRDECSLCGGFINYRNTEPLGHSYGEWAVTEMPGCGRTGEETRSCARCGIEDTREVAALTHSNETTTVAPTCTEMGYDYTVCMNCGQTAKSNLTDALGHDLVSQVIQPTCIAKGYTQVTCRRCDHSEKNTPTEKVSHTYDNGTETKEPTDTAMGRITYTCTYCGDTRTETTPRLENPFLDVDKKAYYYRPVLWAVRAGVTTGVNETHFAPDATCTRAQVVTFLWRAAGCPEPNAVHCPFEDVPENAYYRKAVLWAVEHQITTGVSPTRFAPNDPCTRAQVVTFLYRAAGSPEWNAAVRFQDVPLDAYYFTCVSWAADMGITNGVDGEHFGPNRTCTRAQVVTFLYRNR